METRISLSCSFSSSFRTCSSERGWKPCLPLSEPINFLLSGPAPRSGDGNTSSYEKLQLRYTFRTCSSERGWKLSLSCFITDRPFRTCSSERGWKHEVYTVVISDGPFRTYSSD